MTVMETKSTHSRVFFKGWESFEIPNLDLPRFHINLYFINLEFSSKTFTWSLMTNSTFYHSISPLKMSTNIGIFLKDSFILTVSTSELMYAIQFLIQDLKITNCSRKRTYNKCHSILNYSESFLQMLFLENGWVLNYILVSVLRSSLISEIKKLKSQPFERT